MESSEPAARKPLLSPSIQKWVGVLLLIVGAELWLILGRGQSGLVFQRWLLLTILALCLIPFIHTKIEELLDRLQSPSHRSRCIVACAIAMLGACYFTFTASRQGRDFVPRWQDEQSYAIQIQMLARGRLWMPPHPLADFFDTFQVIVDPVYASMYFPGASLFYVPAAWMHLPFWTTSVVISGACLGLIYWVVSELLDGVVGLLAALMLAASPQFRQVSIMVMGHHAIVLLGLLMLVFWLKWRERKSWQWAAALGFAAGWAAITRPLDAIVVAAPIGLDLLLSLRGSRWRDWMKSPLVIVAGAAPFLLLQLIFNHGVTGSWLRTPFDLYAQRDYPGTTLGFHAFDPALRPVSALPQKQKFHDLWTIPAIRRHQPQNVLRNWAQTDLHDMLAATLPQGLLIVLIPLGLLAMNCRPQAIALLQIPLWIVLFSFYTWLLPHYSLIIAPALILAVLLGSRQAQMNWPRIRRPMRAFLTLGIAAICLTQMHEFNRFVRDQIMNTDELWAIDAKLAALEHKPAVVLFRFGPTSNPHIEPVYNIDSASPDDALVIRAHDLGPRNAELFRYYGERQPQRAVYLYDRANGSMKFLGFASELGKL